jgi:hypothetical protein
MERSNKELLPFELVARVDDHRRSQEELKKLKVGLGVKAVVKYNFGETYGIATTRLFKNTRSIQNL